MNRLIKIGLIVLVALGIMLLGYWLSMRDTEPAPSSSGNENGSSIIGGLIGDTTIPSESLDSSKGIFEQEIISYVVGSEGILAVNKDGHVLFQGDGGVEILASSSFSSVVNAIFSFDNKRILLEVGSPNSLFYRVFDIDKKSWKDLPLINSPVWAPKTHEIAFLDKKVSGHTVSILNADSPTPTGRTSFSANIEDGIIFWPKTNQILIGGKSSAYSASSLWRVDKDKKTWLPIILERSSLSLKWKIDGSSALVLTGSGRGGKLSLINDRGEALRELNVLTLPEKCSFYFETLVCAVPQDAKKLETSFLPDDYLKESFFTRDYFLEIDLNSGDSKSINFGGEADAINLQVQGDRLFFLNRLDGRLYSIKR